MMSSVPTIQEAFNMLLTMDKQTMIAMGYAFYLYIIMDASNARARARARRD